MTAQFEDMCEYQNAEYEIVGVNGFGLFLPANHGLRPAPKCTACWRGFVCRYRVESDRLILSDLCLYTDEIPPVLFGVKPQIRFEQLSPGDFIYPHLNHSVTFTGGLLLARDFIRGLMVNMGFQSAWKYREVHELIFQDGRLIEQRDVSARIAELRQKLSQQPLEPIHPDQKTEVKNWINECFSQKYEL